MSSFDSTKTELSKLLEQILEGKLQLPDFQRGWVWDDDHIRSLLVSIARSFPIGSVMLLETGGDVRFQTRAIEGVIFSPGSPEPKPEHLILDGQQRLTSLTQVLKLATPVATRDEKGRELKRYYYFDIERALAGDTTLDESIIAVDANRQIRTNFGRDVSLDLSTPSKEFAAFHFPATQILNSDRWEEGLMAELPAKFSRYMEFRKRILTAFRGYQMPVIELKKGTSKEAVCLVFEKVNTGGVPLSVFELVTASYAADGFNLRDDWYGRVGKKNDGRQHQLSKQPLLRDLAPTDFLQGISLLHSLTLRQADIAAGKTGKAVAAVTAKREHILEWPVTVYQKWADLLMDGFFKADRFLRMEGFQHPRFLPYRSQLVPLATIMTHLKDRWLEPKIREKLSKWYWCGVLGELYGSAIETRMANDLHEVLAWVESDTAPMPSTVIAAGFQSTRLDTLRSRTSAAYRGIYILLQRQEARDFFWKAKMVDLDRDECAIDIHHIFPRNWCQTQVPAIAPKVFNSIINKTPISYKANRMIGGQSPSAYLLQLQTHKQVQLDDAKMNEILVTHLIDPALLRADDFRDFYEARKAALLKIVEGAMGKSLSASTEPVPSDDEDESEEEIDGHQLLL